MSEREFGELPSVHKSESTETPEQKSRNEIKEWANSFGKDDEWVEETFTFDTDGTVEVEGNLFADKATTPFPKSITRVGGELYLPSLTSAEGLVLPRWVGGSLSLDSLTSAEGLVLPEEVGGNLFLNSLTSAKGLTLPERVGVGLFLSSLTSAEGLVLPESFDGYLIVESLSEAEREKLKQRYPKLEIKD